ncbi:MAG: M20/M25/M40 family metallo-hydrolase, partial [Pseudomonadota bacterium]|nr:M20/M25/M40 family metallo-hydrolase [Pseudomonadota bacterium]
MRNFTRLMTGAIAATVALQPAAAQTALTPEQQTFFGLYKQLVETNTTLSAGSCTQAAAQIATRLKAAGYKDSDVTQFSVPDHPKEGGLVAILPGSNKNAKAVLLLAHLDVVEAKREDWVRDPFTLIEEGGYYYARGTVDDKAMAAVWADSMIRFKQAGYKPKRTIKLALTCGEETTFAWNGAQYLTKTRPDLIAAGVVLNEGGGGRLNADGKQQTLAMQVGEKAAQNYTLTATNPGGHSSMPVPSNAIYAMSAALLKVGGYEFPLQFN